MNKKIYFMENENAFKVLSRAQELEEKGEKIINQTFLCPVIHQ